MKMKEFIKQCKNNREILELSYADVSACLVDMDEKEYEKFENNGGYISEENIDRLIRLLCIEKINSFNLEEYIDTEGLDEDQIKDLSKIVEEIVGEFDA